MSLTHPTFVQTIFTSRASQFSPAERAVIAKVLGRPEAPEAEVTRRVTELFVPMNQLERPTDIGQPQDDSVPG